MLDAVVEGAEVEGPAHDLEYLVAPERCLHGERVENEQQVAVVCKDTGCGVAREHIFKLTEELDDSVGFALVRRPVLPSLSEG